MVPLYLGTIRYLLQPLLLYYFYHNINKTMRFEITRTEKDVRGLNFETQYFTYCTYY
jgi:hypothetical protein